MNALPPYDYWEHEHEPIPLSAALKIQRKSKPFGNVPGACCFRITGNDDSKEYRIQLGYYIGVDWLVEGENPFIVSPKLDTRREQLEKLLKAPEENAPGNEPPPPLPEGELLSVDYFAMLGRCLDNEYLYREIDNLVQIDWKAPEIPIRQSQDWLSPLLIVKYLNLLRAIVRKGLKKSFYTTTENLQGKVKGKILVGAHLKQNIVKHRLTRTVCQYQEFGVDTVENRLLHKAFRFACAYLDNHKKLFGSDRAWFTQLVSYCRPAFEHVGLDVAPADLRHYKPNPLFKEYKDGITLAKQLLKRYAYSIENTARETLSTPPYWIDMPKLFELYAYSFLKKRFPAKGEVKYQFSTYGNALDYLVHSGDIKLVVDAKYKTVFQHHHLHEDMRQLSGYARLEKVADQLGLDEAGREKLIDCLIIYPDIKGGFEDLDFLQWVDGKPAQPVQAIAPYRRMYKVGICLPKIGDSK
ncbi:MAG: restriction endonuclease [Chitinophagaceae bacterium]|nr:MAG: restriction endonuclease [Chitinophagaceae bacterium]